MSAIIGFKRGLSAHPEQVLALGLEYAWLEAPLAARLVRVIDAPDWHDPTVWPAGRVFGSVGEYRWQSHPDGSLHAVLLLESGQVPAVFEGGQALNLDNESDLILWGEWIDPDRDHEANPDGGPRFFANEIPGVQTYPLELTAPHSDGELPCLVVRRYRAGTGDAGEFLRCVGLRMKSAEEG